MNNKEQFFRDLERLRGETFTDEEVKNVIDVLTPILIVNGLAIRKYEELNKMETEKEEPKRLFMMKYYNRGPFGNIKYSCKMTKDITESEALEWYEQDRFCYPMICLFYKKDGEWVFYK